MSVKLQALGNWSSGVRVPLQDAMGMMVSEAGRGGASAVRRAIIYMAQAAKKLTPTARKNRRVMKDTDRKGKDAQYLEVFQSAPTAGGGNHYRIYRWMFTPEYQQQPDALRLFAPSFDAAKPIANRGLAKRSWMWGLANLRASPEPRPPIPGMASLRILRGADWGGYELENRLPYVPGIMPAGWEASVERAVVNRIMGAEANKIARKMGTSLRAIKKGQGLKSSADAFRFLLQNPGGAV